MNTRELNEVLADEIRRLRSGKAKPASSIVIAKHAGQMIAAARLELAYCKLYGLKPLALPFFSAKALPGPKAKR